MKRLSLLVGVVLCGFSSTVVAQECYRSSECEGNLICMDRVCVEGEENLIQCAQGDSCEDWEAVCDDGYCKPGGVMCSHDTGSAEIDHSWGVVTCGDGMGMAWQGDSESDNPDGTETDPVTDEALYDMCIEEILSSCGDEVPNPESECKPEHLEMCLEGWVLIAALEGNCEDQWEDEDGTSVSSSDGDEDSTSTEPVEPETDPGASNGTSDVDFRREEPNPWFLVNCCEEVQEEEMEGETYWEDYLECLGGIAPDDCDGAIACEENIWGDDLEDNDISVDGDPDENGAGNEDLEEDSEQDDSTGASSADEEASSNGTCQFSPPAVNSGSLLLNLLL